MEIPLIPDRQLASNDIPFPIPPQEWHFREAIDYSITANRAVLDYASRNRDYLLYNLYLMASNSVDKGSQDHWTIEPLDIEELKVAGAGQEIEARRARALPSHLYEQVLHDPAKRDPRGAEAAF